jgi:hypothetical protein
MACTCYGGQAATDTKPEEALGRRTHQLGDSEAARHRTFCTRRLASPASIFTVG